MKKRTALITLALLLVALAPACRKSEATRLRGIAVETRKGDAAASVSKPLPIAAATPVQLATLEDQRVKESSGLVASRRTPGLFWTHNDSGDGPFVYAFDRAGRSRGTFRVEGANAIDWEDIAAGPGPAQGQSYLYAADIGDNGRKREFVVVYRFPEPVLTEAQGADARTTQPAEAIRLKYPDGAHNAEAFAVHPTTGDLYVVTKANASAVVYKLAAPFDPKLINTLAKVATLHGPDFFGTLVTGADIAPDGRRVALCDYAQGYELTLPEGSKDFEEVWRQTPTALSLGPRLQGESIAYRLDGAALLATSETTPTPLFEVVLPKGSGQ